MLVVALTAIAIAIPGTASAAPVYEAKCDVAGTLGPVAGLFNMGMKCASRPIGTIVCKGNADPGNRLMRGSCASLSTSTVSPLTCAFKGGFIIGFNPQLWIGDQVTISCSRLSPTPTIPIVCKLQGGGPINKDQTFTGSLTGWCGYGIGE